ncbi:alginate lyase family protein [Streptomyces sp. NPDC093094]|uniref:alginate lyase family protein n=1 Tax=Streptomyces sp. NPDC093094 TaxID=3366026 RepID=UPI003809989C
MIDARHGIDGVEGRNRGRHSRRRRLSVTVVSALLAFALGALALPSLLSDDAEAAGPQPSAAGTAGDSFEHPGALVSKAQLDFVRGKVKAGAEPWKSAYEAVLKSKYAKLSWTPKPWATVECGPRSNPNHGCSDEREDALAAYTHALLWNLTKDRRHATEAIKIMDAWSAVIKEHTNHNAPLQTGWSGASFARAGELMKHTYTGWPSARQSRFATMLRTVYLPMVIKGRPNANGNWELIMMDAATGISVFLDDRASFDRAVAVWRKRVPAYVYLKGDGSLPKSPAGSGKDTRKELIDYWQGQSTFVDGLAQETCRDFGHTGWGFAAAAHVAETARIQGLDLYSEVEDRMTKALEFHAAYELGATVPSWLCKGSVNRGIGSVLEVAYNHYAGREGISLPKTKRLIQSKQRPSGADYFLAWETLTHAGNPE